MLGKRRNVVLTWTTCERLEQIRLAIEVITGTRTTFKQIDFNTNSGAVYCTGVGRKEFEFILTGSTRIEILVDGLWYCCLFEDDKVYAARRDGGQKVRTVAGELTLRWVGNSHTSRREVPLFLEQAMYAARVHGMTLDELLASGNSAIAS